MRSKHKWNLVLFPNYISFHVPLHFVFVVCKKLNSIYLFSTRNKFWLNCYYLHDFRSFHEKLLGRMRVMVAFYWWFDLVNFGIITRCWLGSARLFANDIEKKRNAFIHPCRKINKITSKPPFKFTRNRIKSHKYVNWNMWAFIMKLNFPQNYI